MELLSSKQVLVQFFKLFYRPRFSTLAQLPKIELAFFCQERCLNSQCIHDCMTVPHGNISDEYSDKVYLKLKLLPRFGTNR